MSESPASVIDRSARGVVCFFLLSAGAWLLAAAALAYIVAAKSTDPTFLGFCEFLTYGKVKAAQTNAFVYGWGSNAAFAVSFWLLARLGQAEVRGRGYVLLAGTVWNGAVSLGIGGILAGHMTAFDLMEMPPVIWPALFISYLVIAAFLIVLHRSRQNPETYVTQWFVIAAFLWFPALFLVAWNGLSIDPGFGTVQSVLSMWYSQNLIWLWLTPVALGCAYYLIPKALGRPVDKYYLAIFGFWCIAMLAPWSVLHHLEGGPVPMWIPAVGTVMSIAMVFPIAVASTNFHATAFQDIGRVWNYLPLRFVIFGTLSYTISSYIGIVFSLPAVAKITQFSIINEFHFNQRVYGFFSMIVFGMVYHMLPRLTGKDICGKASSFHFWTSAAGVMALLLAYLIGGLTHGVLAGQPELDWASSVITSVKPYFLISEIAFIILGASQLVFVVNVALGIGSPLAACFGIGVKDKEAKA